MGEFLRPCARRTFSPRLLASLVEARKALPRDTIVVTDSSNPQNQVFNEFPVYGPRQHITPGECPDRLCPARRHRRQLGKPEVRSALSSATALSQTGTELATTAMLGTPVIFLVINNGGWEQSGTCS